MIYIGIDPGLDGAIAVWDDWTDQHSLAAISDTPTLTVGKSGRRSYDVVEMRKILDQFVAPACYVTIEQQQAMPKQGVSSTFSTGYGYGLWMGLLAGMRIPHETVRPQAWKKAMGIPPKSNKAASLELAGRLWPDAPLRGPRGGGRDGRADALLLAEYGRRRSGPE